MGFFSVNNPAPGAGAVMSNWAGEINTKNKAESYKKAGAELMTLFDALEGEDRVNPKMVNQIVSSVWAKYPDLDQQDHRAIALMAKQSAAEELKYREHKQAQEDADFNRSNVKNKIWQDRADDQGIKQLLTKQPFGGDEYSVPFDENAVKSTMSGGGILDFIERQKKNKVSDLQAKKLQKEIDSEPKVDYPNAYKEYLLAKQEGFKGDFAAWKTNGKDGGNPSKGSYKFKTDKLKHIQNAVKNLQEQDFAATPEDIEKAKAIAATEFEAYHGEWKPFRNTKTKERGYKKPDGTIVDIYGRPVKKTSTPQPTPKPKPTPKPEDKANTTPQKSKFLNKGFENSLIGKIDGAVRQVPELLSQSKKANAESLERLTSKNKTASIPSINSFKKTPDDGLSAVAKLTNGTIKGDRVIFTPSNNKELDKILSTLDEAGINFDVEQAKNGVFYLKLI